MGGPAGSSLFGGVSYLILFIIGASAQYSVIKAPVPDTASPVHGYSRAMAYARPVYFILTTSIVQLLTALIGYVDGPIIMYGFEVISVQSLAIMLEICRNIGSQFFF